MAARSPGELARAVDEWFRDAPALLRLKMRLRCHTTPLAEMIDLVPEGAALLEAGGGAALFPALLAHCGKRVRAVGFDRDPRRVEAAGKLAGRMRLHGSDLDFRVGFVETEWPAGSFDVVAVIDLLHHLPPALHAHVIQTAARRLNRGGILLYKDMCVRPRWRNWVNRLHDLASFGEWVCDVPPDAVEAWAREAGLTLERSERCNRYWYGHELRVFRR